LATNATTPSPVTPGSMAQLTPHNTLPSSGGSFANNLASAGTPSVKNFHGKFSSSPDVFWSLVYFFEELFSSTRSLLFFSVIRTNVLPLL